MRSDPANGATDPAQADRAALARRRRATGERLAKRTARWPVGRVAGVAVIAGWVVIALVVVAGLLSVDVAAFMAAGVFTLSVAAVFFYDAFVEWFDPEEGDQPLPPRLQPAPWLPLDRVPRPLRVVTVPACFILGSVIGHFLWH